MSMLERWHKYREVKESDRPLEYGTGGERYHMVFKVVGGNMYHPTTYFLTTDTNRKELSQPEMNAIGGELLRKKYGGAIYDVHIVKRYDRTGKWKG
jgi:hypothetical protein